MNAEVAAYYDRLAPDYDSDRFGNSYGRFLDREERAVIAAMLPRAAGRVLDLGCGTGRLTNFATDGCDISREGIRIAALRHPACGFAVVDGTTLPYPSQAFDAALCFHVLMHLDQAAIAVLLTEVARVLKPGGVFVVDAASELRQRPGRRRDGGWHGATSLSRRSFAKLGRDAGFSLTDVRGIALTPIHRIPAAWRRALVPADLMMAAVVPSLSSYLVARFVRDERG